uniref:Uncharacterized protein n=1 Tax=Arundo donax TaxID=35708 RepID=A0A0A9B1M7_ARUDO
MRHMPHRCAFGSSPQHPQSLTPSHRRTSVCERPTESHLLVPNAYTCELLP